MSNKLYKNKLISVRVPEIIDNFYSDISGNKSKSELINEALKLYAWGTLQHLKSKNKQAGGQIFATLIDSTIKERKITLDECLEIFK